MYAVYILYVVWHLVIVSLLLPFAHVFLVAAALGDVQCRPGRPFRCHHLDEGIARGSTLLVEDHVNSRRQDVLAALAKKRHDHVERGRVGHSAKSNAVSHLNWVLVFSHAKSCCKLPCKFLTLFRSNKGKLVLWSSLIWSDHCSSNDWHSQLVWWVPVALELSLSVAEVCF